MSSNSGEVISLGDVLEMAIYVNSPRLCELKGKYSGRIWMIGNGPSLANTPLHLLNGEYSIGMNAISLIYPKTTWRPSFFMCINVGIPDNKLLQVYQDTVDLGIPSFVQDDYTDWFIGGDLYPIFSISTRCHETGKFLPGWSSKCENIVWRYATSMYMAAQVVTYMGFTELYLLGCDMGWKRAEDELHDPNHFTDDYEFMASGKIDTDVERHNIDMVEAHQWMKIMGEKLGFKIFNATLGGSLEVHPRVDILDVLK
jgi:hypothetical protein